MMWLCCVQDTNPAPGTCRAAEIGAVRQHRLTSLLEPSRRSQRALRNANDHRRYSTNTL